MCHGCNRKSASSSFVMDSGLKHEGLGYNFSLLLELSAKDDLIGFKKAVEEDGHDIDESSLWYGRIFGSKKMGYEERTPLIVAAMFGSMNVLSYILRSGRVDVNRACGSDGATALHCAVAGGSAILDQVAKVLLDASADVNAVDANGNRPGDLIAPAHTLAFYSRKKALQQLLNGADESEETLGSSNKIFYERGVEEPWEVSTARVSRDGTEKKEYPVDLSLPDIKNGIYSTDEFRMYTFKIKPCTRAYSHDWTECPFVHPGENARRRDPRKYHYSCVPCPEFRKGTCRQGDACEYAHGIFECWLHPAQYRTRLCKDETGCTRKVCFFAHKPEELRPLYASTGSAVVSPRSICGSSLDIASISSLTLGSPSAVIPPSSTPPMTPSGVSSPMGGTLWQTQCNIAPPTLQLPGSRLKAAWSARDIDLDVELLGLENQRRRQQQLMDELSCLPSPSRWNSGLSTPASFPSPRSRNGEMNGLGGVNPTNLEDIFGSVDPATLSQLQGLSLDSVASQVQSPSGIQMRQNMNQSFLSRYANSIASPPARASQPFGVDMSVSAATSVLSSRAAAFAKRSQSFIERGAVNRHSGLSVSPPATSATAMPLNNLSDWGSPDGKLDWGIHGEELHKLRKSASIGLRGSCSSSLAITSAMHAAPAEPDVSWVQSLVKDAPTKNAMRSSTDEQQQLYHLNNGDSETVPTWVEQMYLEQEQLVA
ncbi:zinc finger CCCH domain-containing protein 66 isoform X1 [Momordica charantia]|uniref:Zinc finger CCCH domain-containing protein 66 isoform X1 n=2 Tax=Momordica charantia TaxID=3673 RepID=A0A6J1D2S2_MOMCH|nr:zinc finger CCCH domain-containing protein 66 isoform X1 [Momordica charantia]